MNLSLYIRGDNSDHHSMLVVKIFMKKLNFIGTIWLLNCRYILERYFFCEISL